MAEPMKIRATLQGDVADVRILMLHPMETGQRRDAKGEIVPLHFIQSVLVTHNGRTVLDAQWSQAISRNPFLGLRIKGAKRATRSASPGLTTRATNAPTKQPWPRHPEPPAGPKTTGGGNHADNARRHCRHSALRASPHGARRLRRASPRTALAVGRQMLAEDNPGELWVLRGESLFHEKRGPKNASLEQCDFGMGPGKLDGAFARLPRYFADTDKVEDLESRLLTCMVELQGLEPRRHHPEPVSATSTAAPTWRP